MVRHKHSEREIPAFKTEQEEAEWWDKQGPALEGTPADVVVSDAVGNIVLVEFKFNSDEFYVLAREADRCAKGDFVALIRSWVQERTAELMEAR